MSTLSTIENCGWDTETYLISAPDNFVPPLVCCSWHTEREWQSVLSTGDADLWPRTKGMWEAAHAQKLRIIAHNAPFDITVAMRYCLDVQGGHRPGSAKDRSEAGDIYQLIWDTLEKSLDNEWNKSGPILVSDTLIREKLLDLSTHGSMTVHPSGRKLQYGLAELAYRWLDVDVRSSKVTMGAGGRYLDKNGKDVTGTAAAGDAWRLRYAELDGIPASEWPVEAYRYALLDARLALQIWAAQERTIDHTPGARHYTANSEALQVYAGVALNLAAATGFRIDPDQVARVNDQVSTRLGKLEPVLVSHGIIRSNGSVNKKVVEERVNGIWEYLGRPPIMTELEKGISTGKEVLEELMVFDPVLSLYAERQVLAKMRDAFLPTLSNEMVWTSYDILKETGRVSSRGNAKGKKALYPAFNCQQIPRRPGVRECMKAAIPGYIKTSVDYRALELCSTAQNTYWLFGQSTHRDKINAGYDLHSFLGSAIAALKQPELVNHQSISWENMDNIYESFLANQKVEGDDPDTKAWKKRFKLMRNMAKPVGLGYPGGLGADTMVVFARTTYHVELTRKEAEEFKELWFTIYPEMVKYFAWVRDQYDLRNKDEEGKQKYCYVTPGFDRFRAGAYYCAVANGRAMQSLSADGAKRAGCWIARACAGAAPDTPYAILADSAIGAFIHDEYIVQMPDDDLATERSLAVSSLMCQAMQVHMPDVTIAAEPALMRRWRKEAEPEYVSQPGRWDRALNLAAEMYGNEVANQVAGVLRAPGGQDMRLVPWEDVNSCEVL